MSRTLMVALASGLMIGAAVNADVTPIGPFTGEQFENFESLQPPGGYPGPFTILGGHATINDQLANTFVFATVVSSASTNWVNFFPYDGFLMGLVPTGWTVITFDPPVKRFGGYIGSSGAQSGGTITFKDAANNVLSSDPFTITPLQWGWYGWQSDVPIARIELLSSSNPGNTIVYDNLTISVNAGASCYANCDNSTTPPVLNVLDFSCFLNRFAAGDTWANCDQSTTPPVLNVLDFACFLNAFAAGCT
jgi:hypothetical protein